MDRQARINRIRRGVAVAGVSGLAALWAAVWGLGQGGTDDSAAATATPSSSSSAAVTSTDQDTPQSPSSGDAAATQALTTRLS